MFKTDPFTLKKSGGKFKVLERHNCSEHGKILKNDKIGHNWGQKNIQPFIPSNILD